jgi:hypothetical protein
MYKITKDREKLEDPKLDGRTSSTDSLKSERARALGSCAALRVGAKTALLGISEFIFVGNNLYAFLTGEELLRTINKIV